MASQNEQLSANTEPDPPAWAADLLRAVQELRTTVEGSRCDYNQLIEKTNENRELCDDRHQQLTAQWSNTRKSVHQLHERVCELETAAFPGDAEGTTPKRVQQQSASPSLLQNDSGADSDDEAEMPGSGGARERRKRRRLLHQAMNDGRRPSSAQYCPPTDGYRHPSDDTYGQSGVWPARTPHHRGREQRPTQKPPVPVSGYIGHSTSLSTPAAGGYTEEYTPSMGEPARNPYVPMDQPRYGYQPFQAGPEERASYRRQSYGLQMANTETVGDTPRSTKSHRARRDGDDDSDIGGAHDYSSDSDSMANMTGPYSGNPRTQAEPHYRRDVRDLPKLPTFNGKPSEWRSFIWQFRLRAKTLGWNAAEKVERLLSCLQGKAVDYVFTRPKHLRSDYYQLRYMLTQRYQITEIPVTARRQLSTMKQEEQELLEDFADRVLIKVTEAYPSVSDKTAQTLGVEGFLSGCRDRVAAGKAAEHKPVSMQKALQCVKDAKANMKQFGRPSLQVRQVTFADQDADAGHDRNARAAMERGRLTKEQENTLAFMTQMMAKMTTSGANRRPTSPSPERARDRSQSPCWNCKELGHHSRDCRKTRRCFRCSKEGHYSSECTLPRSRSPSPGGRGNSASPARPTSDTGASN